MWSFVLSLLSVILFLSVDVSTVILDVDNQASISAAAATLAHRVQELYNGNRTGGVCGKWPYPPYYWWESGGSWGAMMEYWHFTGDQSYNDVMVEALVCQLGPNFDFNRAEESFNTGNDDQAFWVFVAMSAAEYSFPELPAPLPPWLRIVQIAWESYAARWGVGDRCNGGLKWQFHPGNAGYFYKNSISNGAFFQLSARLARFTGNSTYVYWANKIWDWSVRVHLIDDVYNVFDGTDENIDCTAVDHHQWTYNVGVYLYGAAVLQNYTNASQIWVERTLGLLNATSTFVSPYANATDILFEAACEPSIECNIDQLSMKAYLARWMAGTSIMAPFTAGRIGKILRASAIGAAMACTAGHYGNTCGSKWYTNSSDGLHGLGQQLSATEVTYALLVNQTNPPKTLPNVFIQNLSDLNGTGIRSEAVPQPTGTARPLHDEPDSGGTLVYN